MTRGLCRVGRKRNPSGFDLGSLCQIRIRYRLSTPPQPARFVNNRKTVRIVAALKIDRVDPVPIDVNYLAVIQARAQNMLPAQLRWHERPLKITSHFSYM
jgi:hypothetical protein